LAIGWIAPYQKLCGQLLELAAKKKTASHEFMCAQPVEGEVDHEALTREIIARFPKILAALAE